MKPPQPSFVLDESLLRTVDELRDRLKLSSREEVIARALALLKLAAEADRGGGGVMIQLHAGKEAQRIELS